MTFLKQQCEENRERAGFGRYLSSGGYTTTRIDAHTLKQITHTTAFALRKEIEKRLPEEEFEPATLDSDPKVFTAARAHNTLRTQVLEIIRELVPVDELSNTHKEKV